MIDLRSLLDILQAGGNAAMIGLFFLMWKFDRRLVKIETVMSMHLEDEAYLHSVLGKRISSVNDKDRT